MPMIEESPETAYALVTGLARQAGMGALDIVPYSARHAGASGDRAAGVRSLGEIKKRGRWASDSSVKRYEQGGRILAQLQKLDARTRDRAIAALNRIGEVLSGSWLP